MEDMDELMEYGKKGYACSQMMMLKALEFMGKESPEAVRAVTGFAGGLGYTGEICGVLTGAVAVLGLYAGKGSDDDMDDPRLQFMITDLVRWFREKYGEQHHGINCRDILENNYELQMQRCPEIIQSTFAYVKDLLINNGFDLSGMVLDD